MRRPARFETGRLLDQATSVQLPYLFHFELFPQARMAIAQPGCLRTVLKQDSEEFRFWLDVVAVVM